MANPIVATDVRIYWGGYDVTGDHNQVALEPTWADNADNRFGDVGKAFYPGIMDVKADAKGFFLADDGTSVRMDAIAALGRSDTVPWPLTVLPIGDAVGRVAYSLSSRQFSYKTGGKHGDSLPFEISHRPSRLTESCELIRQHVAVPKASISATTTGTGVVLGVLAAGYKLVATVHMFGVTGGSWVVTIESDDNAPFASAVTRLTFTAATDITRETKELVGPVATDTYWRAVITKTGGTSCIPFVSFGIAKA
jgi:hypothetical protein